MSPIRLHILLLFFLISAGLTLNAQAPQGFQANEETMSFDLPEVVLSNLETKIEIHYYGVVDLPDSSSFTIPIEINGQKIEAEFETNEDEEHFVNTGRYIRTATLKADISGSETCVIKAAGYEYSKDGITTIPGWLSIIPPLLAILMALVFREVITSLFTGIFIGAAIIHTYISGILGVPKGLLAVLDTYILESIADKDHVSVIVFSMLIGGMVAIISRNGGMQGVVNKISGFAKDARSGQMATWIMGVAIFFDDYANSLVVGNTMRPITDRLKISREKLSYLVDSTAAPISAIAFVTTWIGAELGYIEDGISGLGITESPYGIFLGSLQYSFYPILTLIFMLFLIWKQKDFGPMLKAERRARTTGQVSKPTVKQELDREQEQELDDLQPVRDVKPHWMNAAIPVAVVIFGTVIGLLYTGWDSELWNDSSTPFGRKLSTIIGDADSYSALLWSSLSAVAVACLMTIGQKIMSLEQTIDACVSGFKTMLNAMLILIMAWALAEVTKEMHTADYITSGLAAWGVSPIILPAVTFVLAGIVAFSTGSSWSTMAILYPLMIPATWLISKESGLEPTEAMSILYNVVASVLAGAVLGDHCSPISDTTILSSLATSCNHIDHVRTQLPYALTVGTVCIIGGIIPGAMGVPFWISFPVSLAILYGIVHFMGKSSEVAE